MKPIVRRKEIKIRAELNEIETKKTIERIKETKRCFFKNRKINAQILARLAKKKRTQNQNGKRFYTIFNNDCVERLALKISDNLSISPC